MVKTHDPAVLPDMMSVPAARFFASDWEASSFLEFFVDLKLRVADDEMGGAGRTAARLADHARFALQLTILKSVDGYVAYLAEIGQAIRDLRRTPPWQRLIDASIRPYRAGTPSDVSTPYTTTLIHGNVRQLDRLFLETTDIQLFRTSEDLQKIGRLVAMRNLIAHDRAFAADELAALVDEATTVGGLGIRLSEVRQDLEFLRESVRYVDRSAFTRWAIDSPISRASLFDAIRAASHAERGTALVSQETSRGAQSAAVDLRTDG